MTILGEYAWLSVANLDWNDPLMHASILEFDSLTL